MTPDALRDAHAAIKQAIADLRALGIAVPISLHQAAHALSYAITDTGGVIPFDREPGR